MSQITTHVVETSTGQPALNMKVSLEQFIIEGSWALLSESLTDKAGQVSNLLDKRTKLSHGKYRLVFHTGAFYQKQGIKTIYPEVKVVFEVFDKNKYHIPLLLNPFGYSTYRGN